MERNVSMEDISDGRLYGANDMVRADCNGCKGCSECCEKMGDTIILDPYDIANICGNLQCSFEQLLGDKIELGIWQGLIMPHIRISNESGRCGFLNDEGRCSIHSFRPGFCRLFPLGRFYEEDGSFKYFLQIHECTMPNKSKVKVKNWIGISELSANTEFIEQWHGFTKKIIAAAQNLDDTSMKTLNMYVLKTFYMNTIAIEHFYEEFSMRLSKAMSDLGID